MTGDDFARDLKSRFSIVRARQNQLVLSGITPEEWHSIVAQAYTDSKKAKPKALAAPPAPKPRDVIFDAIATVCRVNLKEMTPNMAKRVGVAKAQIVKVTKDVDAEEIVRRGLKYRQKHPQWELTPNALATHWGDMGNGERTELAKNDPYVEPGNWRPVALRLFPDALKWVRPHDWRTLGWQDIDLTLRRKILEVER